MGRRMATLLGVLIVLSATSSWSADRFIRSRTLRAWLNQMGWHGQVETFAVSYGQDHMVSRMTFGYRSSSAEDANGPTNVQFQFLKGPNLGVISFHVEETFWDTEGPNPAYSVLDEIQTTTRDVVGTMGISFTERSRQRGQARIITIRIRPNDATPDNPLRIEFLDLELNATFSKISVDAKLYLKPTHPLLNLLRGELNSVVRGLEAGEIPDFTSPFLIR